uniref:Uncharacterized protein n=1 Tax=Anguilla anguilla TaxID=7936 RepID=A0A0E9VG77_ANGAN
MHVPFAICLDVSNFSFTFSKNRRLIKQAFWIVTGESKSKIRCLE